MPLLAHLQSSFGSKAILQGGSLFRGQTTTPDHPFWSAEGQIRIERVRAFLKEIAVRKAGALPTPPEEVERRRKFVEAAHHNNLMAGIERDPTTDPIFEAFIRGDIDITDILPAIRSLDTDTE
ncbi:antitoxin VbhA family protein [Microvirga terrae]|uniref:Antitoxin VbhA family protein n=1 Tax=Microvirga terrae TaxID=2740529 RepID=A0ABY5RTG7_9HYPH|nr:antitoxin VbhA family protein [Microvirga terrae]UVF20550.1 antitoxin VbhA family protein [Microvirga terrae]